MLNAKRIAKIQTINFGVLILAPFFYLLNTIRDRND